MKIDNLKKLIDIRDLFNYFSDERATELMSIFEGDVERSKEYFESFFVEYMQPIFAARCDVIASYKALDATISNVNDSMGSQLSSLFEFHDSVEEAEEEHQDE